MKQLQLTDDEIQVTIGLLLNVRFTEVGSNGLKNAAAIVQRLEQAEPVPEKHEEDK